ncbi:MAG TPA: DNA polymerase Y family protein [Verrucomicrobiae bacterium]|jgi:protein ImuB
MFAVVQLPDFFLQAALRPEPELRGQAVALVDARLAKPVVVEPTAAARRQGVEAGMTPSQAAARCPGLAVRNRNAAQELCAAEILLQTAFAFSPNIESTAPGVCTLDLTGLPLQTEAAARAWAAKLLGALARFNLDARAGFGPNPGLAWLAARAAAPALWLADPKKFIFDMPVSALRPPMEILQALDLWGVQTIGNFAALGKDQIAARLGQEAVQLLETIETRRPLKLVSPPVEFAERMDFEREIETTEALLFVLNRFIGQLALRLDAVYLVVAELHLRLALASGDHYERVFKIPSPTNNLQILFRMLQTHLETLRADSPVTALELRAEPGKAGRHQFGLFEAALRDPNQFAETLARLSVLCGPDNAGSPQLSASLRPDSFRMAAPEFSSGKTPLPVAPRENSIRQGLQLRRFRPPLAAHVEFRGNQPALIHSQRCRGPVVATQGPFASSGDWWEPGRSWAREEWDVQTEAGLYRVFRSPEGCFVEGVYD